MNLYPISPVHILVNKATATKHQHHRYRDPVSSIVMVQRYIADSKCVAN